MKLNNKKLLEEFHDLIIKYRYKIPADLLAKEIIWSMMGLYFIQSHNIGNIERAKKEILDLVDECEKSTHEYLQQKVDSETQ